jgi:hypothetical protein
MIKSRMILTATVLALSGGLAGCAVFIGGSDDTKNSRQPQLPQVTASDEMFARVRLIAIAKAEAQFQFDADGEYGTLEQLIQKGFIVDPSQGQVARYKFEIRLRPHGFDATAVPEKYGVTGDRSFFIDETNTIRAADKHGEKATAQDPPA